MVRLRRVQSALALAVLALLPPRLNAQSAEPVRAVARLAAPGRLEIRALAAAYPDRIAEAAFRDGDWALRIDDTWYYWASGRLLPAERRFNSEQYTGVRFYNYSLGRLVPREIDDATAERLRARSTQPAAEMPPRHNGFLDALYQISVRTDAYRQIVDFTFLGLRTQVHRMIVEPLRRVEQDITQIAEHDEEVRRFVSEIRQASAFHWREIAGTNRRSYHSYGVAIDLIPRSYGNRFGYWRWAMESGVEEWWDLPERQRWQVPQPVIDSFERHGFIWGGKWLSFDPIHFEYRPEVILLSRWREAGLY